jgi:membrane fusion protein, multidrug efflux system
MKRKIFTVITFVVLLAGGVSFVCNIASSQEKGSPKGTLKPPQEVRVISAAKSAISQTLELTGSVEPYRIAQLASPAEGPVLNLRVREGDLVKTGDTLLSIGRKKGVDALILSLREDLKKEEDNLKRTQQLVQNDALPGEQLDQAKASYERARAQLTKAEEMAQDYFVAAPWVGVVSRLKVKEGDFVVPRAPLVEIYDPVSLVIRVAVPEKYAAGMRKGLSVTARLDAYPGATFAARIVRLYPYLDERVRTRTIEVGVTDPVDLLPGMFARLILKLKQVDDAIVVPLAALITTPEGGKVVFVVHDSKAIQRKVKTGIEASDRIQVLEGINPGDKVIVSGHKELKDGMDVRMSESAKQEGKSNPVGSSPTGQDEKKKQAGGEK